MTVDLVIAAVYCLAVPVIGVVLARRAAGGLESYFLGDRRFGALLIGLSGMTDWFDLSGTMVITSLLFLMGPRGLYVEFRGGAVMVVAFLMLWVGKWHRRSGCMTPAEWVSFRFGEGRAAEGLRTALAVFNAAVYVGMLAYAVRGAVLFFGAFLPYSPEQVAGVVIGMTVVYTTVSGFYGVTVTNLIHGVVLLLACLLVGGVAWQAVGASGFDGALASRVTGVGDWMCAWPSVRMTGLPPGYENREYLLAFTALCLARVVFGGMGLGDEARYFAAKDDRSCGMQTLIQVVSIAFRWPLMIGFAVLGILMLANGPAAADPGAAAAGFAEQVIPRVMAERFSPVLRGVVLAALIGALMSTFACALNSAAATCVRDLYQRLWRPTAGRRELIGASYASTFLLAALSFWMGVRMENLNGFWGWLAMGLTVGNSGPMFLRLYWWRCTAGGASVGILAGLVATLAQRVWCPEWNEGGQFALSAGCSLAGTVIGSLLTRPVEQAVTERFVRQTRPFGWWGVYGRLLSEEDRREHRREITAVPFVMITQVCLFLFVMQAVLHDVKGLCASGLLGGWAAWRVWRLWGRYA